MITEIQTPITDEKAQALVSRANLIVAAGFGREGMAFPEHVAIASPLVAEVFRMLVAQEGKVFVVDAEPVAVVEK